MRIDFSEPECSTCFHYRTSGMHNAQESEPSNVIGSPVPVSSGPVQALGHDTSDVPVQALGHDSSAVGSTSTSSPVQALGHDSSAVGSTSTSTEIHSSSPFTSGAITPSPNVGSAPFGAPKPSTLGSVQAPTFGSGESATFASSTSSPAQISLPHTFRFTPAVPWVSSAPTQPLGPTSFGVGASAAPTTPSQSSFGPAQGFGNTASASASQFGTGFSFARPDVGVVSASSSCNISGSNPSTTTVCFGTTPVSVSSQVGTGFSFARPVVGAVSASSSCNISGSNPSTTTAGFGGATPMSVSSPFGPAQHFPKTTSVSASSGFGCYLSGSTTLPAYASPFRTGVVRPDVGSSPAFSSFSPFGRNAATTLFPSSPFSSSSIFSSNPSKGSYLFAPHESNRRTGQGSRIPGYAPTRDDESTWGDSKFISISASSSYQHKSHEELRWEDYKEGGLFTAPHITPTDSRLNPFISASSARPLFACQSIPDHPQKTNFATTQGNMTAPSPASGQTNGAFTGSPLFPSSFQPSYSTFPAANMSSISLGVPQPILYYQSPYETTGVSYPASCCTACGATTSSSASSYSPFNGATTPPSAATSLFGSHPMIFGTTPALQAYPARCYIILPFAAMSLQ